MLGQNSLLEQADLLSDIQKARNTQGYLPWERFEGFMWGLPATWWLIIRHPVKAFSMIGSKGWSKAYIYAVLLNIIALLTATFFLRLIFGSSQDYTVIFVLKSISQFWSSLFIFISSVPSVPLLWVYLNSLIILMFEVILRQKVHTFNSIVRLCLYSESLSVIVVMVYLAESALGHASQPIITISIRMILDFVWLMIGLSATGLLPRCKAVIAVSPAFVVRGVLMYVILGS